jgi:hypothetical protein
MIEQAKEEKKGEREESDLKRSQAAKEKRQGARNTRNQSRVIFPTHMRVLILSDW